LPLLFWLLEMPVLLLMTQTAMLHQMPPLPLRRRLPLHLPLPVLAKK
jgi:hypothetical protein